MWESKKQQHLLRKTNARVLSVKGNWYRWSGLWWWIVLGQWNTLKIRKRWEKKKEKKWEWKKEKHFTQQIFIYDQVGSTKIHYLSTPETTHLFPYCFNSNLRWNTLKSPQCRSDRSVSKIVWKLLPTMQFCTFEFLSCCNNLLL